MNYTNAQFRSILNGLGYRCRTSTDSADFPVTEDNSALTKDAEAIKKFQDEYDLVVDGVAGSVTMAKAEQVMRILQDELNQVVKANLPQNQPFYGVRTRDAVKVFQGRINKWQNGVANHQIRLALYDAAQKRSLITS